jgi:hypothetical protein
MTTKDVRTMLDYTIVVVFYDIQWNLPCINRKSLSRNLVFREHTQESTRSSVKYEYGLS